MRIVVPVSVALIALATCPGYLFHYDITSKVVVLEVAAAAALLIAAWRPQNLIRVLSRRPGMWFALLLTLQIAWFALAAVLSPDSHLSLFGSTWRREGLFTDAAILLFALLSCAWFSQSQLHARNALRSLSYSGGVLGAYVVLQYFRIDPLIDSGLYRAGEGPFEIIRPPGTFGHADYVAAWLVLVVLGSVALCAAEARPWPKYLSGAAGCLAAFAVLLTGTRSAVVGLGAGLVVFALLSGFRIGFRNMLLGGAALAVVVAFAALPSGRSFRARLHWISEERMGGARLLLWRDSFRLSRNFPWLGAGPETFSLRFPRYESRDLSREYPDFYHESPHNMFLDELTACGIPGILLLCGCLAFTLVAGLGSLPNLSSSERRMQSGLLGATTGMIICGMFTVLIPATCFGLYLAQSLVAGTAVRRTLPEDSQAGPAAALGVAATAMLFLTAFSFYAFRLTASDFFEARARRAIKQGNVQAAQQTYAQAVRWRLGGGADDVAFARLFAALAGHAQPVPAGLAAMETALQCATRSVRSAEDRQNAWYNLALLLATQNDLPGVDRSLRAAAGCAPNWFKPHWKLAQVLALEGKQREALAEAAEAVDLDGGKHDEVRTTAAQLRQKASP